MPPASHSEIDAAAALLKKGGVVAFPTETVYGLGAEVSNPSAVARIFEIKRRPLDHPLIVHFADASRLSHWAREVPQQAWRLTERFWPGPLTLILPRSGHVLENVTAGQDTVGLRVPDHPVALALLRELGPDRALAAPSANRFGHVSPTTAAHVREEFGDELDMVLDGGPCQVGLESTIVGFEGQTAVILRPGGIQLAALAEVLDGNVVLSEGAERSVRVPGALPSHYAPATPLELLPADHLWRRALELEAEGMQVAVMGWRLREHSLPRHRPENEPVVFSAMPEEPEEYARQLYATLRRFDRGHFDRLLVEKPPETAAWVAIADRLRRASSRTYSGGNAGLRGEQSGSSLTREGGNETIYGQTG
ncbi:MAG: translation factor [Nitrosospira multiformis]|jgi:L-threonylcarbamoyladenylate synthase|nr:translation factor [Nitrosospira multiformis]